MISLIIPTYNRERDLEKCLASIRRSSRFRNEIIVLSPDLPEELAKICKESSARLFPDHSRTNGTRRKSLWRVINEGIGLSMNDFVCWLNDDCVVNDDWDRIAMSYFLPSVGLVILRTKGINMNPEYDVGRGYFGVPCANYAVLRKSCGIRFDESYSWFYGDADISLQVASKTQYKVIGTRENLVVHEHRMDVNRRSNETDPRGEIDKAYFKRKWAYKKQQGDRVVDMTAFEKVYAVILALTRTIYRVLRYGKIG